jgi:glycosyltransferase involved in cell wall biosynthesis
LLIAGRTLKIVLLAPFEEPVPPKKYGGTELIVYNLAEELVGLGHDVTLIASGDSTTTAKLVPAVDEAIRTLTKARNPQTRMALKYQGLANALNIVVNGKFDILHNHYGWQLLMFKQLLNCPIITTLHGTLADPTEQEMYSLHREMPYISISESQRLHGPQLNYVDTVYNGIQVERFEFNDQPKDYLAFLGRISPQKGPEYAIELAKKTNQRLIIAAKIDPVDESYFRQIVEPLIDGEQISFIGEVDHTAKVDLLKYAKALISPLQWDEPFGIVNVEALACGTPVITINRGSMPEILIDGKTGFLCSNIDEMISRVADIDTINRQACRDHVEQYFTAHGMAEHYLKTYESLLV